MLRIDLIEKVIHMLANLTGRKEGELQDLWHELLAAHDFDFKLALVDFITSSLYE